MVFWTHAVKDRARGWLDERSHHIFRELMLHVACREQLLCPIYTLMPDHFHLIWMGLSPGSDQRRGTAFLRSRLAPRLTPFRLQHQAYDHVLRESERRGNAFLAICAYVAANPVRAGLVPEPDAWPFTSCIVPGYPDLTPLASGFWEKFWKIYGARAAS